MDESEKDASRQCAHNYELKDTRISEDETEYVKTYVCTECGHECEKRSIRIGVWNVPSVIM